MDGDFVLRVICADAESHEALSRLHDTPSMRLTPIADVERFDPQLLATRRDRSDFEYCWTAKAPGFLFYFDAEPEVEVLTYVDSDLHFMSSPDPLLDELGEGSVLLTPHRGARELDEVVGTYQAGWVTFRNDARGREALHWWRERCIEWCYDRHEPGLCGDQFYLEEIPVRFDGVRVTELRGANVGNWNEPVPADEPIIFFHHSGLRASRASAPGRLFARVKGPRRVVDGLVYWPPTEPATDAVEEIWRRYAVAIRDAFDELEATGVPAGNFVPRTSITRALLNRR